MKASLSLFNFWTHPRFWRHFWAWAIFFFFLSITIITTAEMTEEEDFFEGFEKFVFFISGILGLIYSSFYAYNKLYPRKQYLLLGFSFIVIIFVFAYLNSSLGVKGIMIGGLKGFWAHLLMYPFFLIVAFGFKLAYHGIRQLVVIERLKTAQVESELKLLKSQVNPHFLFNTLNNIYATNLENHDQANEIILELADLLRYQLKSQSQQMMPLSEEISILLNYISLEKLRVKDCEVRIEKEGDFQHVKIVPLLLLPFVENAFKYGTGIEPGQIDLKFDLDQSNVFTFFCRNKIVQKNGKVHSGGIGLENVKKRLELGYAGQHELDISNDNDSFRIHLKIKLQ